MSLMEEKTLHGRWAYATGDSIALTNLVCRHVVSKIYYILTGTGIPNYIFHFISIEMNFIEGLNLVCVVLNMPYKGKVRCVLPGLVYI